MKEATNRVGGQQGVRRNKPKTQNKEQTPRSIVSAIRVGHGLLFKPIMFDSQTPIEIMESGSKYEFNKPIVRVRFGVGKDHVGYLIMEEDAWNAFCDEGVQITF